MRSLRGPPLPALRGMVRGGIVITDREIELRRLKNLRHFELLAEVFTRLPRTACEDDVWLLRRYRHWSRDRLITELLPPYQPAQKVVAA